MQAPEAALLTPPIAAFSFFVLATACGSLTVLDEKECQPGCVDSTTLLSCDASGQPSAVPCPTAKEPCATMACAGGECRTVPAVDAPCGAQGEGRCNDGYACLGPGTTLTALKGHTCALAADGKVWCWGDNRYRQVGDGTTVNRGSPVPVRGLTEEVVDVSAGYYHTCAVGRSGHVYCWGWNENGQSSPAGPFVVASPTLVDAGAVRFTAVRASLRHNCALTREGGVYCWGNTLDGQCGVDGAATGKSSVGPTLVLAAAGSPSRYLDGVRRLDTVNNHTCVVRWTEPWLLCWGSNRFDDVGETTIPGLGKPIHKLGPNAVGRTHSAIPIPVDLGTPVLDMGVGIESTFAVTEKGTTFAWGLNTNGQLGVGESGDVVQTPRPVLLEQGQGEESAAIAVVPRSHGKDQCARTYDGAYYCWGKDDRGELGFGTVGEAANVPRRTILGSTATSLVRGEDHACVTTSEFERTTIQCYGEHSFVARGDARQGPPQSTPMPVVWNSSSYEMDLDDLGTPVVDPGRPSAP